MFINRITFSIFLRLRTTVKSSPGFLFMFTNGFTQSPLGGIFCWLPIVGFHFVFCVIYVFV